MIEAQNLTKYYGPHRGIEGVSFSVQEGEVIGFLGPNGAGKTTTFRVLTCYHPPTSGRASVAGFDVFTQSAQVRRQVGYLPESVPLYPEMRVREYLRFRGKLRGLDRAQRESRIAHVAERCWVGDVLDRPIGQLSKGYRQRVGLADALLHDPRVLILDEPTIGLDPVQIRETGALIRELAAAHTVMLSSHILPQVESTCGRLIIIHKGRIVASGTLDELRQRAGGQTQLIAELRGPQQDVLSGVKSMNGVAGVKCETVEGWTRVTLASRSDLTEPLYRLASSRGWPLRQLRCEAASLEDIFVNLVMEAGTDRF
jgi:ABC-2 type transport system ATP-binding protein